MFMIYSVSPLVRKALTVTMYPKRTAKFSLSTHGYVNVYNE